MSNIYYKPFYSCYSFASHTHTQTHTHVHSQLTNYENILSCSKGNHVKQVGSGSGKLCSVCSVLGPLFLCIFQFGRKLTALWHYGDGNVQPGLAECQLLEEPHSNRINLKQTVSHQGMRLASRDFQYQNWSKCPWSASASKCKWKQMSILSGDR